MTMRPPSAPGSWYRLLRPLLFALPAEAAHGVALAALRGIGALPPPRRRAAHPVHLLGLDFPNRVGVAAGLDKNAVAMAGLARLGFGFVEVGTVTPRPQRGNPKPRLFRLTEDVALVNRMGFNSAGADAVAANLRRAARRAGVPIGINIGKNRDTPLAAALDDYRACLARLHDHADYFTVNISSPNTPGLRDLQTAPAARSLVAALASERDARARRVPLLVKIAPDLAAADMQAVAEAVLEAGADGIVAVNTTLSRPASLRSAHACRPGGLSGRPLLPLALDAVRRLRRTVGDGPAIIGVGGIAGAGDARRMVEAGADLVQVYSALIFAGPGLVECLIAGTREAMKAD